VHLDDLGPAEYLAVMTLAAVVAGYAVIYCLPCLVLLLAGRVLHERLQQRLQRLFRRLATGTSPRSVPAAIALAVLGIGVASIAATA
jgi:hypothetical protein